MKRTILAISVLLFTVASLSAKVTIRKEDITTFLKTKTYVVLDNNPMSDWNIMIRKAVTSGWDITPYEFITDNEFEKMKGDIDKSFLVRLKVRFPKDKIKTFYNFMSVVLGSSVSSYTDMPEICSVPLGYEPVDQSSWGYKLLSFVRFAQKHIRLMNEHPELLSSNPFEFYNKNMPEIKGKELWLIEKDLAPDLRSLAKLRNVYDGVVRFVTADAIEEAIAQKKPNVLFLHKVGPEGTRTQARVYKAIMGADDDKLYYFDYHTYSKKNPDGLLKKDFKRINKR